MTRLADLIQDKAQELYEQAGHTGTLTDNKFYLDHFMELAEQALTHKSPNRHVTQLLKTENC